MISHRWTAPNGSVWDLTEYTASTVWLNNGGIEGLGTGSTTSQTQRTAGQDGQRFNGWIAEPREVFWPVVIDGTDGSWLELQRDFWAALPFGEYGLWRVTAPDGSWRELSCRFVGDQDPVYRRDPSSDLLEIRGVELIADDPWWRGPDVSVGFSQAADPVPFFATSSVVLNIMSSNTVASASITNPGELPAWATYRLDGPLTSFDVEGTKATMSIAAGEYLIIDTDPRVQTAMLHDGLGGVTDVTEDLDFVNWSMIPPNGSTSFDVTLNGTGSLLVTLIPRFRRAF